MGRDDMFKPDPYIDQDMLNAVRNEALREAAAIAANIVLLHDLPRWGEGTLTAQRRAADEARQQIAKKILDLIPEEKPVQKVAPEWMPLTPDHPLLAEAVGYCDRCNRSTWNEQELSTYCTMTQPSGYTCGGRFIRRRS